ncbi:hypothetical protein WA538_001972 [Blastocystis sp. DL]
MGYKAVMSALGYGTFFGGMTDVSFDDDDSSKGQDSKSMLAKSRNSYLVLIGSDSNKYCFLYQPESVVYSFGGSRRAIFEQTLVGLHIHHIITIVANDGVRNKINEDAQNRNISDRWHAIQMNQIKRSANMRLEIRKLKNKISGIVSPTPIVPPYTIIFDLGEYSADFLKMLIHTYRNSCVQYVIYNRKRTMTNIKSINLMMQRAGYRRVQKVQSQLIATFVIKTSPIWK